MEKSYIVGDRVIILRAEGYVMGSSKIPLKDPHPEHIGKTGELIGIEDGIKILLNDGTKLDGSECWWAKLAEGW